MAITEFGYLEQPYLSVYGYLSGQIHNGQGMQVELIIEDEKPIGFESEMIVNKNTPIGQQTLMKISSEKMGGMQSEMFIVDEDDDKYTGMQTEMVFPNASKTEGFQAEMSIKDDHIIGMQSEMFIEGQSDDKYTGMQAEMVFPNASKTEGFQAEMTIKDDHIIGMQSEMFIEGQSDDKYTGMQAEMFINNVITTGMESRMFFKDVIKTSGVEALMKMVDRTIMPGFQVEMLIEEFKSAGVQIRVAPLAHYHCEKYLLNAPYLTDAYLSGCIRAFQGMQSQMRIFKTSATGMQVDQLIETDKNVGMETEMRVFTDQPTGFEANMIRVTFTGQEINMVIYNITQLRILGPEFPSRGTPSLGGVNWTSIQPTKSGHFSPNNLNTDVLEERTETDGVVNYWELRNDSGIPQGVFIDTVAILDHNFSKSARITLQGSNDPSWGSVGFNVVMVTELVNMFYIAPVLPTESYRYHRFLIEDSTNTDGFLRIGAIVFGTSDIFTVSENFDNPVKWGKKHFKDTTEIEGYTTVSNDRGIRKNLGLDFSLLKYNAGNYRLLHNFFDKAKTDLKCLIIPRPTRPSALAVFAKLSSLPDETHQAIDDDNHHVTLSLDWDESN